MPVDCVIDAAFILPGTPEGVVLRDHSVAIAGDCFEAILPTAEMRRRYQPGRHIALLDHVLMPGLINLHTHAAMSLMRGLADDVPLHDWLNRHIWPGEATHAGREFVRDGTLLACTEMIRAGVTCFNDMYLFSDAAAEAARLAGLRATLGLPVIDFPSRYADTADAYFDRGLAILEQYGGEPGIQFCLAPHSTYAVSEASLQRVGHLSEARGLRVHMHLHETRQEVEQSVAAQGRRPLARLAALGLVNERLLAVHGVHLNGEELEQMAACGAHLAHCPTSNLKLGSGIAPIAVALQSGVNVGLGTDGAASNNRLDLLGEMRLASLLAKGMAEDAQLLPAATVLAMATRNAAQALGLAERVGAIETGKEADLVALRLSDIETLPCFDVAAHVVHVLSREQVSHVWVRGRCLLEEGRLTTLDADELRARVRYWRQALSPHARRPRP